MTGAVDLRDTLTTALPNAAEGCAEPQYLRFYEMEPERGPAEASSWLARGQNCVVWYASGADGTTFERPETQDEYVVLLPDVGAVVTTAAGETEVDAESLVVVPPGRSSVRLRGSGRAVLLLTSEAQDLLQRASNAAAYDEWHANVAPLECWPDPPAGPAVRVYRVADHPYDDKRFARIFRTSSFMVNWFDAANGPRDPDALSPHIHDDFEQLSLVLDGSYVHHIRTPWGKRLRDWRADDHETCDGPSLCIIPPPAVHTSQAVGTGRNLLIDIFCPPRVDFSEKPGWVLNADDYPTPSVS